MLELTSSGQPVQLSPGTSVQLVLNSPLFDEDTIKGQFSYSFSVPAGPNGRLYGFPERPDTLAEPGAQRTAELAEDGLPLLRGTQRVKSATPAKYSVALAGGLSGAGLSERQLSSFDYGGLREVPRLVNLGPAPTGEPVLNAPGISLHANEVVAHPARYGYVFAPLRNEYLPDPPDPVPAPGTQYGASSVNIWSVTTASILNQPAGGNFSYGYVFSVLGGLDYTQPVVPAYCPFPRLGYVLQCIFEESGLAVDLEQWLPGELGDLVIVGNAQLVDRGDLDTMRFQLADVLPALTVAELLAALRQDLGIVVYVEPLRGRVRTGYLVERVATEAAYADLTSRLTGAPEVSVGETPGLTLTYHVDSRDELTKDLLDQQPAAALLLPPVATVADLPATALLAEQPLEGQARLVLAEDRYYVCTLAYFNTGQVHVNWLPLGPALPPVAVAGGGPEQAQRTCYTTTLPTVIATGPPAGLASLPAISQPPFRATDPQAERSAELRLLFYNGRQLAGDGLSAYPQLSHRSASGALSVRLSGEQGTYQQLLRSWLPVKLRGTSYKFSLQLTALDLSRLDWSQPLRLDGVRYLVRKLTATVPLRKPASVELVRL